MSDDADEILRLIAIPKLAHNWSGFQKRSNHAGSVIGIAQLSDSSNVFLPGITVEIEVKAPIITSRCLLLFTLMRQRTGVPRHRIFQLEVCPADKRSHNGASVIYGPHQHIGEQEPTAVSEIGVNCDDWDGSLAWFLRRINLTPFGIENPC
jgi:hypothetical protein